ncbi:MAG: hypothetical protein AAF514_22455 [Verrucomicrobiota bacterium]
MRILLLMILFLAAGCERRVADPEWEAITEWLCSEEGRKKLANQVVSSGRNLEQSIPCETWRIRKAVEDATEVPGQESVPFLLLGEESSGERCWAFVVFVMNEEVIFDSLFFSLHRSEAEGLGDPVSLEAVREFLETRKSFLSERP